MALFQKLYEVVLTFSLVMLLVFIISNVDTLGAVSYSVSISSTISFTFTLNFYAVVGTVIGLGVVFGLIGVSVVGTGLNEEGTKNVSEMVAKLAIYLILLIPVNYYFGLIEGGSIATLLIGIVFMGDFIEHNEGTTVFVESV